MKPQRPASPPTPSAAAPAAPGAGGALLAPDESARLSRPLRAWRADQRQAVQEAFQRLAAQWHRDWGLRNSGAAAPEEGKGQPPTAAPHAAQDGGAPPLRGWRYMPRNPAGLPWQPSLRQCADAAEGNAEAALSDLCLALFGEPAPLAAGSLALETARLAWADWWRRLAAQAPSTPTGEGEGLSTTGAAAARDDWWSGRLQVQLPWCGGSLVLQLEPTQVRALLEAHAPGCLPSASPGRPAAGQPAKVDIATAIGSRGLALRATLGGVELSLRQLQSLRVGDVVPLEHRLDEPAQVESTDATVVCRGWLGQQAGRIAVELVSR